MNNTIEKQLSHKSIRKFKKQAISKDILDTLFDVANRTASSVAMQAYSIIRVTDKDLKREISQVCNQDYINETPEFVIFLVDLYRNTMIVEEMGHGTIETRDMDKFFQGFTDGSIAAQNMYTAIESLGMGAVFFGSILNDSAKIIELLDLPKFTFPIVGLGFGYPDQEPGLKPRIDKTLKVFENKYKVLDGYLESLKAYDEEMQKYYDLRNTSKPLDSFSKQVVGQFENPNEKRIRLLNIVKDQGFDLKIN